MTDPRHQITRLLDAWSQGDTGALPELMPLIVDDLRRIARSHLAHETPGHTLQPTALVNEAYLWLVGRRTVQWQSRAHFFSVLAGLMRRILVDHARERQSAKRGGNAMTVLLDEEVDVVEEPDHDLLAVDEVLERLARLDPRQGQIVELRFFGGLTFKEIAEVLGVSSKTVQRDWQSARLWLYHELRPPP